MLITALSLLVIIGFGAPAEGTPLIQFQGSLTDSSGTPLTGAQDVTFRIYDAPTGGTACWTESHKGVSVNEGQVNVLLGSIVSLKTGATACVGQPEVTFDSPRYLGITVGGAQAQELVPRQQLVPAFYADAAAVAKTVVANGIANEQLRDGVITQSKLSDGAVTSSRLAEGAVTTSRLGSCAKSSAPTPTLAPGATPTPVPECLEGAVESSNIRGGSITETKLSPDLVARLRTLETETLRPKAHWTGVIMTTLTDGPILERRLAWQQWTSGTLKLKALEQEGNLSVQIACASGQSTGADCGATNEALGFSFDPPRKASYEVCVDGTAYMDAFAEYYFSEIKFKLIRTSNSGPVSGPIPDVFQQPIVVGIGVTRHDTTTQSYRICRTHTLSPSTDLESRPTWRLFFVANGTQGLARLGLSKTIDEGLPGTAEKASDFQPESGYNGLLRVTIKEL